MEPIKLQYYGNQTSLRIKTPNRVLFRQFPKSRRLTLSNSLANQIKA